MKEELHNLDILDASFPCSVFSIKGTIYKAANYEHIDTIKADFYVLPSGERVHPVTMWHRHKTRAWEVLKELYPGIKKAEGFQLKFLKKL